MLLSALRDLRVALVLSAPALLLACSGSEVTPPDNFDSQNRPVTVVGAADFTGLATGTGHSCGVRLDHSVACWGWNLFGQLGTGSSGDFRTSPTTVGGLSGASRIAAGNEHTCALLGDGTVSCWGKNDFGQIGDGTAGSNAFRPSPVKVQNLTGVASIHAGGYTTCALMQGGSVRCWGLNSSGQIGDGTTGGGQSRSTPTAVLGLTGVTAVSVGSSHVCVVTSAGKAKCWGGNSFGQLGDGTTTDRATPVDLVGPVSVGGVAAGGGHTCVAGSGTVSCLGANGSGQLGAGLPQGQSGLVAVPGLDSVESVSAGSAHTCAVLRDGTARCWGAGADGQLGAGTFADSNLPVTVRGLSGAVIIYAGGGHSCALMTDHSAKCWGRNNHGQLGLGHGQP